MPCYTTYRRFLAKFFPFPVQKLPLDLGATCPVRDGKIGWGGCAYCNRSSFVPACASPSHTVSRQLAEGKAFFRRRHCAEPEVRYLAYLQNGCNTYGPVDDLLPYYEEALRDAEVCGLVIATRPDCLTEEWAEALQALAEKTFVLVELGAESIDDNVLAQVGRGHDFECTQRAVRLLHAHHIHVGLHLIFGLPHERPTVFADTAETIGQLPVEVVKLHHLQILKGSRMAEDYLADPSHYRLLTLDDYVEGVAQFLRNLPPQIAVERLVAQAPADQLIAPSWGVKPDVVVGRICRLLEGRPAGA